MSILANITVETAATVTANVLGNATGRPAISYTRKPTVTKCYGKARTATGADSIDVTALTDLFGNSISFATVTALEIQNTDATHSIVVSGNLLGTDTVTVGPGRVLFVDTDRTVDGTHKTLTVTPAAGTVIYNVIMLGS